MKIKKIMSSFVALSLLGASIGNAIACTSLVVTDTSGRAYHGRTLEFASILPSNMTFFPAGSMVVSFTPSGKQGKTFNTKYAFIGMSANLVPNAKQPLVADGMNDQGLSMKTNWLNTTTAVPVGNDDSKILAVTDLTSWILGSFKSVAELKTSLGNKEVDIWLPVVKALSPNPFPQHYHVVDKTGDNVVIEFTNGKLNVYDSPVGVMTNGPDYPWHIENLNNYTFNNVDKNTGQLGKLKLATPDAGIALTSLPSAATSQGRFVKAAFYANYVRKGKNPDDAIVTLAHIMNNFDRPYDLTIDAGGGSGDGVRGKDASSEVTIWTTMSDLTRNHYYVRSINGMNFAVIDLNKLKDVKQIKSVSTYDVDKVVGDAFTLFTK